METRRTLTVLTLTNLGMLISLVAARFFPSRRVTTLLHCSEVAAWKASMLGERSGHPIHIAPAGPGFLANGSVAKDGRTYRETVLFRLIRPDGPTAVFENRNLRRRLRTDSGRLQRSPFLCCSCSSLMPHAQANSPWWLRQPGLLAETEAVPERTRRNSECCGCCTGMQAPGNVPCPP